MHFKTYLMFGLLLGGCAAASAADYVTAPAGGSVPFSNYQPSLALTQTIAVQGIFPPRDCCGTAPYLGMVHTFAGNFGPFGMPQTAGQLLPISQNTALFSILGTQYGGNGKTNFALPNLVGRTVIGKGQGPGLENFVIGQEAGAADITLTEANLPAHAHTFAEGVTSITGSNMPFDNYQPSLAMTYMIATTGIFPSQGSGFGHTMIGEVGLFGGNFQPGDWMPADGRLLAIDQYDTLFNLIGTTFGGDGQTTFALPDLRGRAIVGVGQGPGLSPVSLGEMFGTPSATLTQNQMPAHSHDLPTGGATDPAGGSQPFSTEQPSLGLNYIIALQGVFPSQTGNGSVPDDTPYYGEIIAFAGNFAPKGWAFAQGQLMPIAQNQALFSILGTTYGGDGKTTFALPDLRGRTIVGAGLGFDLGMKFGSETTTLTLANLATHTHDYSIADGVPEPASWAMMIAGFAAAGGAMRRRKTAVAFS